MYAVVIGAVDIRSCAGDGNQVEHLCRNAEEYILC